VHVSKQRQQGSKVLPVLDDAQPGALFDGGGRIGAGTGEGPMMLA